MTTMRQLITGSMRLIRVVGANETPSDEDVDISKEALAAMLASMQNDLLNIYTTTPKRFQFTAGATQYTLGPPVDSTGRLTGANWITERPMRVERAVLLQDPLVVTPAVTLVSEVANMRYATQYFNSGVTSGSPVTSTGAYFSTSPALLAPGAVLKTVTLGVGADVPQSNTQTFGPPLPQDNDDATQWGVTYEFIINEVPPEGMFVGAFFESPVLPPTWGAPQTRGGVSANQAGAIYYRNTGAIVSGTGSSTQSTYTTGDIIGVVLNPISPRMHFFKNGIYQDYQTMPNNQNYHIMVGRA